MDVLIGFEASGIVRQAFRSRGYNAWSCDLMPARDNSPHHYECDIHKPLWSRHWDLIILHPECTALTVAGNHVYAAGKPKHHERLKAIRYTEELWLEAIECGDRVVLENPQGVLHTNTDLPKPQYIQPYQFGDDASKKTGLTLHNLDPLVIDPENRCYGRIVEWPRGSGKMVERWANQTDSGQNILSPGPNRARDRAETYPGIASAFAEQWGEK